MSNFTESSDYSFSYTYSGSGSHTFTFPHVVRQFFVTTDTDLDLEWLGNTGTWPLMADEGLTVPIQTSSVTVTPSANAIVRILGIG